MSNSRGAVRPTRADDGTAPHSGAPAVRVALVGAGKMAQHHARAVAQSAVPARVVAVADPSEPALEAMLRVATGASTYPTLEALLAAETVDVVHVCTPPATHEDMALTALRADAHVYVEKPFAPTVEAADRILALAAERGLKVCAGHQLLFEGPSAEAQTLLPAVGTVVHAESYFSFRTVRRAPDGRTPMRDDLQLLDILPHPVYLLLRLLERAVPEGRTRVLGVEVGPAGTVHALIGRGQLTGSLVVTLEGRPVESYLRVVGTNGTVHADFVRGTVQRQLGPGTSGIDKLLNPYRVARQLAVGTTGAMGARVLKRQRSYPGLTELFSAFYAAVRDGGESPVPADNILDTVRVCEEIGAAVVRPLTVSAPSAGQGADGPPRVAVTGGTGFLGKEVVQHLVEAGDRVLVLSRREPPEWERIGGADYRAVDLSQPLDAELLRGVEVVIHCAAATSGGWEEHQAHSLDATENILRAAGAAGVARVVHVSSLAVLEDTGGPIGDDAPLLPDSRSQGPYVWGKLESERIAQRLGTELGVDVRVVRPGALIDERDFDPPGKLGRRVGNLFVAVGSPSDRLGVADVRFSARTLAWIADHFEETPDALNLLDPKVPTKRSLLQRLRRSNPDLRVVWLPRPILHPLSWTALGAQKVLRPKRPAIDVAAVFARQAYDTSVMARLAAKISPAKQGEARNRPTPAPSASRSAAGS